MRIEPIPWVKRLAADAPGIPAPRCSREVFGGRCSCPKSALLWGAVIYPNPTQNLRDCIVRSYDANSIVMFM